MDGDARQPRQQTTVTSPSAPGPESSRSDPATTRSTLDILLQICTVELFQSLGVAAAPLVIHRHAIDPHNPNDLVGVVTFSGPNSAGRFTLLIGEEVYQMLPTPVSGGHARRDAVRELTNQLAGRVKNRLMQFQLVLSTGLPTAMSAQAMLHQRVAGTNVATYVFRTLRGEVLVTFEGTLGNATLNYSNAVRVPKEGEFIPL
jgi:hypothetical protein